MSDAAPRGSQHRQPARVMVSRASEPDDPIITMPLEAATGEKEEIVPKLLRLLQQLSLSTSRGERSSRRSRLSRPTRRRSFSASSVAICWSLPAEASPEPMRSAQEANARSGCSGSRNSPPPSYGMRLDSKTAKTVYDRIWQSPLKRGAMAYQRGSLKKVRRKEGEIWVLRYRVTNADGRRVENIMPIGLVREFPKDKDAWREVDRLGLSSGSTTPPAWPASGLIPLRSIISRPISARMQCARSRQTPSVIVEHIVRDYLVARFGNEIAEDIKPLDIQRWLKSLHETTVLPGRRLRRCGASCSRIYKVGILHERVTKNPVQHVETRSKTNYRAIVITPAADACDSEGPPLTSSLHAGAHLCRDGAPCFGDPGAALVGHPVE